MITYLISGASRGLGLGLVERVLELQDTRVIAAARSPGKSEELQTLAKDSPDRLTLLTLDTSDESSIKVCGMRTVQHGDKCLHLYVKDKHSEDFIYCSGGCLVPGGDSPRGHRLPSERSGRVSLFFH